MGETAPMDPIDFQTNPSSYRHFKVAYEGSIARVEIDIVEDAPLREGYTLKLNSYDLGVDIELADIVQRMRFEHPEVRSVVVTSAIPKIFCAGANIYMLGSSSHAFKVNFCKYTNETRNYLEEACSESGQHYIAALNGVASGGGYELALACEEILLCDDGNSAVSFPETPLLAVLPGTGGLTRLVDKRKVRRDRADVFSTLAEGMRGKRSKQWNLVDDVIPKSKFDKVVLERAEKIASDTPERKGPGVKLPKIEKKRTVDGDVIIDDFRYVSVRIDKGQRLSEITMLGPDTDPATTADAFRKEGAENWAFKAFRELDQILLDLRFNHPEVGLIVLRTKGEGGKVKAHDDALDALAKDDWFAHEVRLNMKRVLKRLDLSAKSLFAIIEPGSCFVGSLLELALAADRSYMLDGESDAGTAYIGITSLNMGPLPMSNGLTRLQTRFLGEPSKVDEVGEQVGQFVDAQGADDLGLVTYIPDDIDWEDEVRLAIEERVSLSPDALTGMEASLRFAGPETLETKIFGRLSAWQNWIFQRPNAVGQRGALTMYGQPERPEFDWRRT